MSDQLSMFGPMTSADIPSVTSLPESESGAMRSALQDGQTIEKSGQDLAPASPSVRQAKAKRSTTKGIFGQSSFASSKHEDLSFALGNRLRPLTDSLGSTLFSLTWTTRITPAGRSISALRASEARTEGSAFTGWPTPKARDYRSENEASLNWADSPDLNKTVLLTGWKTPCVPNGGRISGNPLDIGRHQDGTKAQIGLENKAKLTGWNTPQERDWKGPEGRSYKDTTMDLNMQAAAAAAAYPAQSTAFGETPIGYLLGLNGWEIVPACGQLNAAHSRWLMGLPPEWDDSGVTAMG